MSQACLSEIEQMKIARHAVPALGCALMPTSMGTSDREAKRSMLPDNPILKRHKPSLLERNRANENCKARSACMRLCFDASHYGKTARFSDTQSYIFTRYFAGHPQGLINRGEIIRFPLNSILISNPFHRGIYMALR